MTQIDARRTKASIVVFLLLTFGLSSIFYRRIIRPPLPGIQNGHDVLWLMWCPGISGLLTRLIFQRNWRGEGFGWGKVKYQFASCWIPLTYASAVYLPVWFAGYFAPRNPVLTQMAVRFPALPQWLLISVVFACTSTVGFAFSCTSALGEELGWRGFLVPQLSKLLPFPVVGLISGVTWALWHYPLILFSSYRGAGPLWYSLLCFTIMVIGIAFLCAWMRLRSGSVWTGMFLHAGHNIFIQSFFDAQTRHSRFTDLWTTEFGAGLAMAGVVMAAICYSKRDGLPIQ